MSVTQGDIERITSILRPLLGHSAWGASLGVGSFLTIEFGEPVPRDVGEQKTHGGWHLWVCHCAWRIDAGDEVLAGSDDSPEQMKIAIDHLNGLSIRSVALTPPAPDVKLFFDGDTVLQLFPINFSGEYEHWMLFVPDGNVLTIGEENGWSFESASRGSI